MARRSVVILECDRCGRKEEQPPDQENLKSAMQLSIRSYLQGAEVAKDYTDLCTRCSSSVQALLEKIFLVKKDDGEE